MARIELPTVSQPDVDAFSQQLVEWGVPLGSAGSMRRWLPPLLWQFGHQYLNAIEERDGITPPPIPPTPTTEALSQSVGNLSDLSDLTELFDLPLPADQDHAVQLEGVRPTSSDDKSLFMSAVARSEPQVAFDLHRPASRPPALSFPTLQSAPPPQASTSLAKPGPSSSVRGHCQNMPKKRRLVEVYVDIPPSKFTSSSRPKVKKAKRDMNVEVVAAEAEVGEERMRREGSSLTSIEDVEDGAARQSRKESA
ncbi:hypothetical protein JCM1840_004195 [Sporobolomyces johnsonii]